MGRTPQGVRGLKYPDAAVGFHPGGRTPQGVRGLKLDADRLIAGVFESHPARGAWIEMGLRAIHFFSAACRTPQGVRGLKLLTTFALHWGGNRRTPQGVRGLKSFFA